MCNENNYKEEKKIDIIIKRSICRYVVSETGCFHYSPNLNSPYREVEIKWHEEKLNDEYSNLHHYAYIYYYKIGFAQLFN